MWFLTVSKYIDIRLILPVTLVFSLADASIPTHTSSASSSCSSISTTAETGPVSPMPSCSTTRCRRAPSRGWTSE